jgi:dTDP-glucose pyrophosphorylase
MISNFLISPSSTIEMAMAQLDKVGGLGLVVVDGKQNLVGSLTDGDIRRAIIAGKDLSDVIEDIVNHNPIKATIQTTEAKLHEITADKKIKIVPIVDGKKVVNIFTIDDQETKEMTAVIMAGGLGSRLGEHTKDCPKPMLEVGGKPILERIVNNFKRAGFQNFFFSVNYKAEMIENYFKDGKSFGCQISYLKENKRLGTAGSLSLLPKDVKGPIVVTNGDLLTLVDYRRLVTFHNLHKSPITLCTRKYEFQVPFGVVGIENGQVQSINEKPTQSFNVSAGVYVINSDLLDFISRDETLDMPSFIERLMSKGIKIDCFPLIEEWIDIGRVSDLDFARSIYGKNK